MTLFKKSHLQETQIEIEFRVPPPPPSREATQRPYSIQYYVVGDEHDWDWVNLTSSHLDDRIAKIKQYPFIDFGLLAIAIGIVLLIFSLAAFIPPSSIPLGYKIGGLFLSASLIIGSFAVQYGFRSYNFCWGDYLKIYNDRRTVAKYVINGIIITLVLGIIGGIISTIFFLK